MPSLASDPVLQRPSRPEPVSSRAAPPTEPSDSFGSLLDTPRAPQPDRNQTSRADVRCASDSQRPSASTDPSSTKPTETPVTWQATEGQSNNSPDQVPADKSPASPDTSPALPASVQPTEVRPAAVQLAAGQPAEEFAAIAQATAVTTGAAPKADVTPKTDATPKTGGMAKTEDAAAAKVKPTDTPDHTDDASATVSVDSSAVAAVAAVAVPVPVAVVVPAPVVTLPAADPGADLAALKPVDGAAPAQAASAPTVPPPDAPVIDAAAASAPAAPKDPEVAAPAAPQLKSGTDATPQINPEAEATAHAAPPKFDAASAVSVEKNTSDAPVQAAALKAAAPVLPDAATPKAPPQPEGKSDAAGKTRIDTRADAKSDIKTGQHGRVVHAAPEAPAKAAPAVQTSSAETPAEPRAKPQGSGLVHGHSADPASPAVRTAIAETRNAAPAASAAPQAGNATTLPFNLAAPVTPMPTMWPVTALRVDANDPAVAVAGLAVEIVARAQDGSKRFEIRLDPPELGRIDVRLDVDDAGKVTSRLTADRAETLDLLKRDAPQLERALQHAGLNTEGGLEFSLRDQSFANRDQAARETTAATRLIIPDDEPAATEAARRGYGRLIGLGGGVDIRV